MRKLKQNRESNLFESHDCKSHDCNEDKVIVEDIESESYETEDEELANFNLLDGNDEPFISILKKTTFKFKRKIEIKLDENVNSIGDTLFNKNNNCVNSGTLLEEIQHNDSDFIDNEYMQFNNLKIENDRLSNQINKEETIIKEDYQSSAFNPLANFTTLMSYTDPYILDELSAMFYDVDTTPVANSCGQFDTENNHFSDKRIIKNECE